MHCAVPSPPENLPFQLGAVALAPDSQPAAFSFQRADGQIETAGDLAGIAAGNLLNATTFDPLLDWPLSAITFGLAPASAGVAALGARSRLTPDKLAECEADLVKAMREMAAQGRFQTCLLKSASEKCPGRLASSGQTYQARFNRSDSILHARVEELRLERTGSGDASYALRIKVRARLVRVADGAVLYDQPAEFRSGACLFLDWTLSNAFQGVAETGYRQLADRFVDRLLATTDKPLLIGAGYKKPYTPNRKAAVTPINLAGTDFTLSPASGGTTASRWNETGPASWAYDPEPALLPTANHQIPVADRDAPVAIYSTSTLAHVIFEKPLTRDEAVSQAMRDTDSAVDGLENHPNQIISVAACAVAVPIGLWKQSAAILRGFSAKRVRETEDKLNEAANRAQPQEELALQVAQQLAPRTSQPVMLAAARGFFLSPSDGERVGVRGNCARTSDPWYSDASDLPAGDPQLAIASHRPHTTLEIHIQRAALAGKGDINPKLALAVEAQATLRSRDGRQLYSCPIKYRSEPLRFTQWASHDARPFRDELQHCYRAMSAALVDQMIRRGFVPPSRQPQPTFAKN